MYYGNVAAFDFEDDDVSHAHCLLLVVSEEEEIAAEEGWLHAATETHSPSMSNRAEKDAVRWCHLTHQVFAGGISS